MRIVCLLPSATDICLSLGLADEVVGITHECDFQGVLNSRSSSSDKVLYVVTKGGIDQNISQGEIDAIVKEAAKSAVLNNDTSAIDSLYPIQQEEFYAANPTIVFTQDLCAVCAPSTKDVKQMILKETTMQSSSTNKEKTEVTIYSMIPKSLMDVVDSFVKLASLCGVVDRGIKLKDEFISSISKMESIIDNNDYSRRPKVLLLEWIDPPFDGGHWIPDMIEMAGCTNVVFPMENNPTKKKSKQITWDDIYAASPDVVIVASCGFGLERNIKDAKAAADKLQKLTTSRIYAVDGDKFFVRPGPKLIGGIAIVARCAFDNNKTVSQLIDNLDFTPKEHIGWEKVSFGEQQSNNNANHNQITCSNQCDIEDLPTGCVSHGNDFSKIHKQACEAGEMMYVDPITGYNVFTAVAHKKRGKCCGSGCRHCPYNHVNVKDKAGKIKEPAFLYEGDESFDQDQFSCHIEKIRCNKDSKVKILFNSGGKDSFLTLRALAKQYKDNQSFSAILMTSFDSQSRIVAHQEISINDVIKQAQHLKIPLVGIPLHCASGESYFQRVTRSLEMISSRIGGAHKVSSLVFGDLHLTHIREWRDSNIGKLGYSLEYPLWEVPYDYLLKDLEESGVKCHISASTVNDAVVKVGDLFNDVLYRTCQANGLDGFGENGEFHSLAEVWTSHRDKALSFQP